MSVLAASAIAAGIGALSSMATNAWNAWQIKKTNQYNESLMRESWQREDNAVQRRVADLKAAGMSPVLAAGSAADSSGPISTQAPKSNFNIDVAQALSLASSLKHEQAETDYLEKQKELMQKNIDNYGKPGWYVALKEVFGAEKFDQMIKSLGDKAYDWIMSMFPTSEGGLSHYDNPGFGEFPVKKVYDLGPNDLAKALLSEKGIDTTPPTPESAAKSLGLPQSLGSDAEDLLYKAMEEGHLNSNVIYSLATALAKRYNQNRDDVLDLMFDIWDRIHGAHY